VGSKKLAVLKVPRKYPLVPLVNVAWYQGKKLVTGSELLGVRSRAKKLRI